MHDRELAPTLFREAFHTYGSEKRIPAGTQIFWKDDPAEHTYYLVKGKVRAYLLYPDGVERTLCFIDHDNLIGEEALAQPARRIVCADAATDLEMYALDGVQLRTLCAQQPHLQQELMTFFVQKISLLCQWIFYAQFRRSSAKLSCLLYTGSEKDRNVQFTQEQIAQVTGMSRMSVSAALKKLTDAGITESCYGYIRILDREKLKDYFDHRTY